MFVNRRRTEMENTLELVEIPPLFVRLKAAAKALITLDRDPDRLDQVLALGEAVNLGTVAKRLERFAREGEGRRLLEERPSIDTAHVDFAALARLPEGTLGRRYVEFLRA